MPSHRHAVKSGRSPDRPANPGGSAPQPATLIRRLAALTYDWVLLIGVLFGATAMVLMFRGGQALPPHSVWYSSYLIGIGAVFFSGFWAHGGQTLGMRAWQIKVVSVDGRPVRWRQGLLRSVTALAGASLLGLGYLWMLLDPQRRCWHDLASGTRVVMTRRDSGA